MLLSSTPLVDLPSDMLRVTNFTASPMLEGLSAEDVSDDPLTFLTTVDVGLSDDAITSSSASVSKQATTSTIASEPCPEVTPKVTKCGAMVLSEESALHTPSPMATIENVCPPPVSDRKIVLDRGMASVLNLSPMPLLVVHKSSGIIVRFNTGATKVLGFEDDQQVPLLSVLPQAAVGGVRDVGKVIEAVTKDGVRKRVCFEGHVETNLFGFTGVSYTFTVCDAEAKAERRIAFGETTTFETPEVATAPAVAAAPPVAAVPVVAVAAAPTVEEANAASPGTPPVLASVASVDYNSSAPVSVIAAAAAAAATEAATAAGAASSLQLLPGIPSVPSEFYNASLRSVESSLPPNVIGFGLDDSIGQRCMLDRIFKQCGVGDDDTETFGSTQEDVDAFAGAVIKRMRFSDGLSQKHESEMLLIIDENLGWNNRSGSDIAQELLAGLTKVERTRVTLFMRSANDEPDSVAAFLSFADGFLSKSSGLDVTTKAVLNTRRKLCGLGGSQGSSGIYRRRGCSNNQWSSVLVFDLKECCQQLRVLGSSGLWECIKATVHKIKGTLMLYSQDALLSEVSFLGMQSKAPRGWEKGGFDKFLALLENFVVEFGHPSESL